MKNMRNYISIFILSLMAMMVVSCQDDDFYVAEGEPMEVSISATPQIPGMESRAVLGNEVNITKYTFLYFAGNTSTSKLAYIKEILPNELPFYTMLPSPGTNNTYAAMLLANVSSADLGNPTVGTFTMGDLVNKTKTVTSADNKPTDATKFTWSGYLGVTTASNSLNFVVNPNLARLDVTFTNNVSSAVEITKLRMRSVPNKVGLAQNALNDAGITTAISGVSYIDYNLENVSIKGTAKTEAWYMPQNMKGNNTGGRQNGTPPANATYLEFDVYSTQNANKGVPITTAYKMYPGIRESGVQYYGGMTNFDVKSGIIYDMDITITTDGVNGSIGNGFAAKDPQAVSRIKLPTGTNCYMIHPVADRITSGSCTYYELPIDRVNEYWGNANYGNNANKTITDNDSWEVDVIWQDIAQRVIYFTDEYGKTNLDKYTATGKKPIYIKYNPNIYNNINNRDNRPYGNIVIGIKKSGASEYLWSWHLWVTDYLPDAAMTPTQAAAVNDKADALDLINSLYVHNHDAHGSHVDYQGFHIYGKAANALPSYSGNVQHYSHTRSEYWGTSESAKIWDTGIYKDKWIMDRYLGSSAPANIDSYDPIDGYGLHYQYGRKDPFPYVDTDHATYTISGAKRSTAWKTSTGGSIANGIANPNTFYTGTTYWLSNPPSTPWYTPVSVASGAKTIFDPCPAGWRLPKYAAFSFMEKSINYGVANGLYFETSSFTTLRPTVYAYWDVTSTGYLNDHRRHLTVLTCLKYENGEYVKVDAAFPFQCEINASGSVVPYYFDYKGFMWTTDNSGNQGVAVVFSSGRQYGHSSYMFNGGAASERTTSGRYDVKYEGWVYDAAQYPVFGLPVRCIQE